MFAPPLSSGAPFLLSSHGPYRSFLPPPMSLVGDAVETSGGSGGAEDDSPALATAPSSRRTQSLSASPEPSSSPRSALSAVSVDESDSKFSASELLRTRTVLLTGCDVSAKREELRDYFHRTFSLYEALFAALADDATFYEQPDALRHPLIFYFGHTAVFFVNKLILARLLPARINASIEATCAIGVDEMSWDDCNAAHYDWPAVQALRDYRDDVRVAVDRVISRMELRLPIAQSDPAWVILMGIEHERIHLETSSVLFRQLPLGRIRPSPLLSLCPERRLLAADAPVNRLVPVPGAAVLLGKADDDPTYGWDNEYGRAVVDVAPFSASSLLVSNAEFLAFVQDGGYESAQWWSEEGWKYRSFRQLRHPLFWRRANGSGDAPVVAVSCGD